MMIQPIRVLLGIAAVGLGVAAVGIIVTDDDTIPRSAPPVTLPANENLRSWSCPSGTPLTASCFYVVSTSDPSVQLFVVRMEGSTDATVAPLLVLGDVPDHGLSDELRTWAPVSRELARDLILVDMPGAGRSTPSLTCPEIAEDPAKPSISDTQLTEAIATCRDRLVGAGVALDAATTAATTDRLEEVRRALGVERWAVLTGGENTRVGVELARRSGPDVVEALVLVSPHSPDFNPYVDSSTPAVDATLAACAADEACTETHGDIKATLGTAVAALVDNPFVLATGSGTGAKAQRVLASDALIGLSLLVADDEARPSVPRLIATSIAEGDWTDVARAMADGSGSGSSVGSLLGRRCAEDAPRTEPDAQEFLRNNAFGWSSLFEGIGATELCASWLEPETPGTIATSGTVDVPVLAIRGEFDPVTSDDDMDGLTEAVPGLSAVEISAAGGHLVDADCGRRIIAQFLADPASAPDACATGTSQTWVP